MYSMDGSRLAPRRFFLTAGIAALVAASGLLSVSALALKEYSKSEQIEITPRSFAWLSSVKVRLDEMPPVPAAALPPEQTLKSSIELAKLPLKRFTLAKKTNPKKANLKAVAHADATSLERDQISVTQASPIKQTEGQPVTDQSQIEQTEADRALAIHRSLQRAVYASILNNPILALNTQIVPRDLEVHPESTTTQFAHVSPQKAPLPKKRRAKPSALIAIQKADKSQAQETPAETKFQFAEVTPASPADELVQKAEAAARKLDPQAYWNDDFAAEQGGRIDLATLNESVIASQNQIRPEYSKPAAPAQSMSSDIVKVEPTPHGPTPAQAPAETTIQSSIVYSMAKSEYSRQPDYSAPAAAAAPRLPAPKTQEPAKADYSMATTDVVDNQLPEVVEAFDWGREVQGATVERLTQESQEDGWVIARAEGHWPTVTRASEKQKPLMSENNGRMLAMKTGVRLQKEAGIVFGRVPEGWTVSLSGRSEAPQFFTSTNVPVSHASFEGTRTFVFLNVEPGAHLLYFGADAIRMEGAVGIPVLGGKSTYVDLTAREKKTIKGTVFDASSADPVPLAKVMVQALGQSGEATNTRMNGSFTIRDVYTIADYPVFVETVSFGGYKHRYQLNPKYLDQVQLFRLSEYQIRTWLDQLEGGISSQSGLIVGVAGFGSEAGEVRKAKVQGLLADSTLEPETYSLTKWDQLDETLPLEPSSPRFVAVQVPEGPVQVQINDHQGKTLWSELAVSSPGVVTLVVAP